MAERARWAAARRAPPRRRGPGADRRQWLRRYGPAIARNRLAVALLWCAGLLARGRENARAVTLDRVTLRVPALPPALDGLRVLHVSDLHVGSVEGAVDRLIDAVTGVECDFCVLTGDYPSNWYDDPEPATRALRRLVAAVRSAHGFHAVLGNYDPAEMADRIEAAGIRPLVNETVTLDLRGERVSLTGTDDPYYQPSGPMEAALRATAEGFRIALVHTPELAAAAADGGAGLYLCGHTHGGQICLPGGRPVVVNLRNRRDLARGPWREGRMAGYTTTGVGASGIAVRYNCPPEAALLTLRADTGEDG